MEDKIFLFGENECTKNYMCKKDKNMPAFGGPQNLFILPLGRNAIGTNLNLSWECWAKINK